ncbi:MAG: thiosulfate sulfurtransferase [Rhodospirillaceae bacterium]|nr:thiosulfate sulfurtransferase [Rhodospirillaceae bacterium]
MTKTISAQALRAKIVDGSELALLDVREEGIFAQSHLLYARPMPMSQLEMRIFDLVPRKSVPVILCDAGEGLAARAAEKLAGYGYSDVSVLEGGNQGWEDAGYVLFSGFNVPSKAFGEFVEHNNDTPNISADELKALIDSDEDMVVLDSRPFQEYHRMNIPTGVDVPGAELAYRVHDIAPSPDTLVVVNCAGRTRSIIGAQSLVNAGIPNRVKALRNGTMGWQLAGYECEHGSTHLAPDVSDQGMEKALAVAERVAARFGVKTIDMAGLKEWQDDASRTTYLLDVRHPEEYEAGHMPGSISAPGGQLVQGTDLFIGTLGAQVVLIDDTGVRATMAAHWLIQMGLNDVVVLQGGLDVELETGAHVPTIPGLNEISVDEISAAELDASDAVLIDLATSAAYKKGHISGAWFANRMLLEDALKVLPDTSCLVLTSPDGILARLVAPEIQALTDTPVKILKGGTKAWKAAGLSWSEGAENMATATDDVVLKPYDNEKEIPAAMNEYLTWELDLVRQIKEDGTTDFKEF